MTCSECDRLQEELLGVLTLLTSLGTKVCSLVGGSVCAEECSEGSTSGGKGEVVDATKVVPIPDAPQLWTERVDEWVLAGGPRRSDRLRNRETLPQVRDPVLPTSNAFDVLSDFVDVPEPQHVKVPPVVRRTKAVKRGVLVIGSSNVRRVMEPFRKLARNGGVSSAVHSKCIPGGTVADVIGAIPGAIRDTGCDQLRLVCHIGTNDVCQRGSEEILKSFRQLAECVADTGKAESVRLDVSVCSLVPRTDRGPLVWSRVEGINQRLRQLCKDEGLRFVDLRSGLDADWAPLDSSGVHYRSQAAYRVAKTLWRNLNLGYFLDEM